MNLLSSDILSQFESRLRSVVRERFEQSPVPELAGPVEAFVSGGGKRIRPQLVVWTYLNATTDDRRTISPQTLADVAAAWELFHTFVLVHDDIIDSSDLRRGMPTLHRTLAQLDGQSPKFGADLAIVAGDLLFASAIALIHEIELEPGVHLDLMRLFSRVTLQTGFGQAMDIIASHRPMDQTSSDLILTEYLLKTAAYTFEGPILSGAILAGVSAAGRKALSEFAIGLGQAYQLQNDLVDLASHAGEGSDLVQGKRTVTILRHRARLDEEARGSFDRRLGDIANGNGHAIELAELLRHDLLKAGVRAQTQSIIDDLKARAMTALDEEAIPAGLKDALGSLSSKLDQTYFQPVPA